MLHSRVTRLLSLCRKPPAFWSARCYSKLDFGEFEDLSQKTSIEMATEDKSLHDLYLSGYEVGGFRFVKATVNGPVAIVDTAVFGWNIRKPQDITVESLALFYLTYPKVDIVVVGTGDTFHPLPTSVHQEMRSRGIPLEVQRTANACGIYNLLRTKGTQLVGAALIPITDDAPKPTKLFTPLRKPDRTNPFIGSGKK